MEGYTYFFPYEETVPHPKQDFWQMRCALGSEPIARHDDFTNVTFLFPLADGTFGVKSPLLHY